jgi:SsrA-binding protein
MPKDSRAETVVSTNRKALHEYFILDRYEAGIVLKGTEVKSLRQNAANLQDGYVVIRNGELWVIGLHISPFDKGNINNHDPKRDRKLLMHRKEIRKLAGRTSEKGLTLIPLRVYFTKNIAKVEIGIAKGKKAYDKREAIARRETERALRREYAR